MKIEIIFFKGRDDKPNYYGILTDISSLIFCHELDGKNNKTSSLLAQITKNENSWVSIIDEEDEIIKRKVIKLSDNKIKDWIISKLEELKFLEDGLISSSNS